MMTIEQEISDYLKKKNKDCLTLSAFRQGVPMAVLKALGLTRKASASAMIAKLKPALGDTLQISKGMRSYYLGWRRSSEDILRHKLRQKPQQRLSQLAKNLPLTKKEMVTTLNRLLEQGEINIVLDERYALFLTYREAAATTAAAVDDLTLFQQAFQQIGQGRNFVLIYLLRRALNWEKSRFDSVLNILRKRYMIELQGGDPSQLDASQLQDSFTDEKGRLRITVSWRKNE